MTFVWVEPRARRRLDGRGTPLGRTLQKAIRALRDWSVAHTDDVVDARARQTGAT